MVAVGGVQRPAPDVHGRHGRRGHAEAAAAQGAKRVLTVEGCLFGVTAFAITLTKRLVGELLRPAGGAYNVDAVLGVMVRGLEKELDERLEGKIKNKNSPSTPADFST